jgi:hypothetical protein
MDSERQASATRRARTGLAVSPVVMDGKYGLLPAEVAEWRDHGSSWCALHFGNSGSQNFPELPDLTFARLPLAPVGAGPYPKFGFGLRAARIILPISPNL